MSTKHKQIGFSSPSELHCSQFPVNRSPLSVIDFGGGLISSEWLFLQRNIVQLVILPISFSDANTAPKAAYRKFGGGIIESFHVDEPRT
jgi:hypothetical protein